MSEGARFVSDTGIGAHEFLDGSLALFQEPGDGQPRHAMHLSPPEVEALQGFLRLVDGARRPQSILDEVVLLHLGHHERTGQAPLDRCRVRRAAIPLSAREHRRDSARPRPRHPHGLREGRRDGALEDTGEAGRGALAREGPIPRSDVRVPGLKPKDLAGMPWRLALALTRWATLIAVRGETEAA